MSKIILALCLFVSLADDFLGQSFLNGSFENNTAGFDQINIADNATFNAFMANTTAFGTTCNMDIVTSGTYCGTAQDGSWFVCLTGGLTDAICLELSSPLVIGQTYNMSFWAKQCSPFSQGGLPIEIGVSNSPVAQGTVIHTTGQPTEAVWTEETFTFVATGNESYISVGTQGTNADLGYWVQVDNFSFNECTEELDLGPDVSFCEGSSISIDATMTDATAYLWQDGSTGSHFVAQATGIVEVSVTVGECTYSDEVAVSEIVLAPIDLGPDTTICEGSYLSLNAFTAGATAYSWSSGQTTSSIVIGNAGVYTATATLGSCFVTDEIEVSIESFEPIELGPDLFLCEGETVLLEASMPGYEVVWQDGSTGSTFDASAGGFFSITYSHGNCSAQDTKHVTMSPIPDFSWQEESKIICFDHPETLDATTDGASYLWNDGLTTPTHIVQTSGAFGVDVTVAGCSIHDEIVIEVIPEDQLVLTTSANCLGLGSEINISDTLGHSNIVWSTGATGTSILVDHVGDFTATLELECQTIQKIVSIVPCPEVDIFIPNMFTPDDDGINDVFMPSIYSTMNIDSYEFVIFNRYGEPVFVTDKIDAVWDGGFLGSRTYVPNGAYAWHLMLSYEGNTIIKNGSILIVR